MRQQSDLDGEYPYLYRNYYNIQTESCLHVVILHAHDALPVRAFVLTMNGQDPMLEPSCQKVELVYNYHQQLSSPDSQTDGLTE